MVELVRAAWRYVNKTYSDASPQVLLLGWFAALIVAGTLMLLLPWAHRGTSVGTLEALFTATSATCVTGLIVVDTGSDFTVFGQWIILVLIQMGGLGIMTFAAVSFRLLGVRFPLTSQTALEESLFQRNVAGEFRQTFWRMLRIVAVIESAGFIVLFSGLRDQEPTRHALYSALFHSVSAFCNAGFSLYTDNLAGLTHNVTVIAAIMVLIILGGLGHTVLTELYRLAWASFRRRLRESPRRLSLHARVVLTMSLVLTVAGAAGFFLFGLAPEATERPGLVEGALFQSVTARTAGFNTVPISGMPLPSLLLLIALMFVGGSPASCAGGVKTTSIAIWLAHIRSELRGRSNAHLFQMRLPDQLVRRTGLLLGLGLLFNMMGVFLLALTERAGLCDILFEQVSAFGTVGLSMGLTPHLSALGRLWIIVSMFVGRIGPLTFAFWLVSQRRSEIEYPEGRVMIG